MRNQILLTASLLLAGILQLHGQGLPPGWDYSPTPSTHIISLPLTCEPDINGWPLQPGDWIGVFYINDDGELACGGAQEWFGDENVGVIAFGNDTFTPEKDGFASGETINYKVFSWTVEKEYDAEVLCNDAMPSPCDAYVSNGLSGVAALDATGFFAVAEVSEDTICEGSVVTLNAIPSGGTGNYTYSWYSSPPGFNSNQQNPAANPVANTTYFVDVEDNDEIITVSVSVAVIAAPQANAGTAPVICQNQNAQLSGTATNYQALLWSTSGDGTFSNPQDLTTQYTPGNQDIANGTATLTLTAQPEAPCTVAATSDVQLQILSLPEAEAGQDQNICENSPVETSPAVNHASSVLWTTSGDGSFDDPTLISSTYYPGAEDLSSGNVTLTITAQPVNPCTGTASGSFEVTFTYLPETNAGSDQEICEDYTAQLGGSATNYQSVQWSTSGDGVFNDPASLSAVYTPGATDISNGAATLTLNALPIAPCTGSVQDEMILAIVSLPEVNAGPDDELCENNTYELSGTAEGYDEIFWTSSGDGIFDDPGTLNAEYTPGANDILNEAVTLTLTATPLSPCTISDEDEIILTIFLLPEAYAGEDATIEAEENLQLNGTASNYVLVLWSTSGDGDFSAYDILDPVYSPGPEDLQQAGATLTLTAFPNSPCLVTAVDELELIIDTVTGVFNYHQDQQLEVFPNPASGETFVRLPAGINQNFSLKLISVTGRNVYRKDFDISMIDNKGVVRINTEGLDRGMYLAILQSGFKYYTVKLNILD